LKNVSARVTSEYCKWHPGVPRHPGWKQLAWIKRRTSQLFW